MSRSGYCEDYDLDNWSLIRWRGAVASAIRGQRGQAFLRELVEALDALPEKRLISNDLEHAENVCAVGSVGRKRGVDMSKIDPDDADRIARVFGISPALVREIEYMNDDDGWHKETPEKRYNRVRKWAVSQIKESDIPAEQIT